MKATNIDWETDDDTDDEKITLPLEVEIPAHIKEEDVTDYLSDEFGFLVNSYELIEK